MERSITARTRIALWTDGAVGREAVRALDLEAV
jgi:hypothetical protein